MLILKSTLHAPWRYELRVRAQRRCSSALATAKAVWGDRLVITEEVEHALQTGLPIVALETAIVTHGMPYPTNLNTSLSLESIIRRNSCTPATIALLAGKVHIGLIHSQLEQLADPATSGDAVKVSRRDLGAAIALKKNGGTTVAGTMVLAHSVGIKSFVTGGIGGVHRGAESSMDVSADLIELGRTPMAVICAGAKSILDIPRTLEVLETHGVCVATYGDQPDFPAFYTPSSGQKSPWSVSSVESAANLIYTSLTLPKPQSTLLAVPIPTEYSERGDKVQQAVEQAVRESIEQGVDKKGKEVTPWLLKRVGELTKGSALKLNIKLIENNAEIGSKVAKEVSRLYDIQKNNASASTYYMSSALSTVSASASTSISASAPRTIPPKELLPQPSVLVFGSAAIDLTSTPKGELLPGTTTPGQIFISPGGVGRNIAEAAQNLLPPHSVKLISIIGSDSRRSSHSVTDVDDQDEADAFGKLLMIEMAESGLRVDGLQRAAPGEGNTAVCNLTLNEGGDLVNGVADMGIIESLGSSNGSTMISDMIREHQPKLVAFDCNITEETMISILKTCQETEHQPHIPTLSDPTSFTKLTKLFKALSSVPTPTPNPNPTSTNNAHKPLTHLSPNLIELEKLYQQFSISTSFSDSFSDSASTNSQFSNLNLTSLIQNNQSFNHFIKTNNLNWLITIPEFGTSNPMTQLFVCLSKIEEIWLKAGNKGLIHARLIEHLDQLSTLQNGEFISDHLDDGTRLVLRYFPAPEIKEVEVLSTTGAGDTLVGGLVAGLVGVGGRVQGEGEVVWVNRALERVGRSLRSRRAVG